MRGLYCADGEGEDYRQKRETEVEEAHRNRSLLLLNEGRMQELKRLSQKKKMKIWALMQTLPDNIVAVYVNYAKEYLCEHRRVVWKKGKKLCETRKMPKQHNDTHSMV